LLTQKIGDYTKEKENPDVTYTDLGHQQVKGGAVSFEHQKVSRPVSAASEGSEPNDTGVHRDFRRHPWAMLSEVKRMGGGVRVDVNL